MSYNDFCGFIADRNFDLNEVWSFKNNVNVSSSDQTPCLRDGLDRGSRGFYSRHAGGMHDNDLFYSLYSTRHL